MEDKEKLYNELKKLSKRANQRILRLERLTDIKEPFAVKRLYDYLSAFEGISKTGRVRVSMKFSEAQMKAMIKATNIFLESRGSLVSSVKKQKKIAELNVGKKLSFKQLSTSYSANELYKWISSEENLGSGFWKDGAISVYSMSKYDWVERYSMYIDSINDKDVVEKLKILYDYLKA